MLTGPEVYDKAKWHYDSPNFPKELPEEQGFVHTGMFLGWIIDNNLFSEEFEDDSEDEIAQFKNREITGTRIYEICDGVLADDMLSEEGNDFARFYFDLERGQYLGDYQELLAKDLPTIYHVKDSWENYDRLKTKIDQEYTKWQQRPNK